MSFRDVPPEPFEIGGLRILGHPVSHPGTTLGYRVEADGHSVAFIPDHEPALGLRLEELTSDWISGFPVADRADLLLHDAQYTEDEYERAHRLGPLVGGARRLLRVADRRRAAVALPPRSRAHGR